MDIEFEIEKEPLTVKSIYELLENISDKTVKIRNEDLEEIWIPVDVSVNGCNVYIECENEDFEEKILSVGELKEKLPMGLKDNNVTIHNMETDEEWQPKDISDEESEVYIDCES